MDAGTSEPHSRERGHRGAAPEIRRHPGRFGVAALSRLRLEREKFRRRVYHLACRRIAFFPMLFVSTANRRFSPKTDNLTSRCKPFGLNQLRDISITRRPGQLQDGMESLFIRRPSRNRARLAPRDLLLRLLRRCY